MTVVIESPVGPLHAAATEEGVTRLDFAPGAMVPESGAQAARHLDLLRAELAEYFAGALTEFTVPLALAGTPFQARVWDALRRIPHGRTRSYADLARDIGRPSAVRAVAQANARNPVAIVVPCHRVIGSDGSMVGYGGGVWRKELLLEVEGAPLRG